EGMQRAIDMLESLEFRSIARRAPKVLGPYVSHDGVTPGNVAVAEIISEKLEVTISDLGAYQEALKFIGGKPFSVYFSTPMRADLFDDTERIALVAIGRQVRRMPEPIAN